MSIPQKTPPVNTFIPAMLKEYSRSDWRVVYYALQPKTNDLKRVQIRINEIINKYRTLKERRNHAFTMCNTINARLSGGWSPFFNTEDARLYTKISDVAQKFLNEKRKELRINTLRSYQSFCKMLLEWCKEDIYCSLFTKIYAVRYMDYLYNERNNGVTTYNNQIKLGRAFFNWAKERMYCKENPFEYIKPKPKQKKTRTIIPPDTREKIKEYLLRNDANFLNVCELVYFSLIRPNEIKYLKVGDIDFEGKNVCVSGDFAKNHHTRHSALSNDLLERLAVMMRDVPKDFYLFGAELTPSKTKIGNGRFGYHWRKLRAALKLPVTMQLYSFRDTGIYEMLKSGIDDLTVMQHADHSSLNITTIYANHADSQLIEKINNSVLKF
jgi:integrase